MGAVPIMVHITNPVTQSAFMILISVLMGICLLIAVAIIRRWQQIRYSRYIHSLRRQYRPNLAQLLSGARSPAGRAALGELPLDDLEILLDPLLSKRKMTARQLAFLQALCADLGLIELWQGRLANSHKPATSAHSAHPHFSDPAVMRHVLRAKSIRNLGTLRHQASWPLLVRALDDRHPDIQLVALRSLAALHAPQSFPALLERLHAVVQGESKFPPPQGLQAALVCFDLNCVPALVPSLRHANHQIRLIATDVLQTIICSEAARAPCRAFTPETLSSPIVELLLTELCVDTSAEVRGRAAQAIVYLDDLRAISILRNHLLDHQWFVRLRAVRALINLHQASRPLLPDICDCLRDSHWRVREAAAQTLLSLGQEGKNQLYQHFLTSHDLITRKQIVEVIERTGLMWQLVEEYGNGIQGLEALTVEQLSSDAAPVGLAGVLRTMNPKVRQRFLNRFLPYAQSRLQLSESTPAEVASASDLQQILKFPPRLAAEGN
jgi:HEAT repeat protein